MSESFKQFGLNAISGRDDSFKSRLARGIAGIVEPFYAGAMRVRNAGYDRCILPTRDLGRPAISIGNITTGGTGKTPVTQWLTGELRARGKHPAILLRGYGATAGQSGDEAQVLDRGLNFSDQPMIPIQACASRVQGAAAVLQSHSQVDVFLLDDAFQHRRAMRCFNLVLISATQPFGYGRVLPRGLLREPLSGLKRADALLITRCSLVSQKSLQEIDQTLTKAHSHTPLYHCDHTLSGLWLADIGRAVPMDHLTGKRVFLIAAIGEPQSFRRQIEMTGCTVVGARWFEDHHVYSSQDMQTLEAASGNAGADLMITTEKDWVKLATRAGDSAARFAVVQLSITFWEQSGAALLEQVLTACERPMR